ASSMSHAAERPTWSTCRTSRYRVVTTAMTLTGLARATQRVCAVQRAAPHIPWPSNSAPIALPTMPTGQSMPVAPKLIHQTLGQRFRIAAFHLPATVPSLAPNPCRNSLRLCPPPLLRNRLHPLPLDCRHRSPRWLELLLRSPSGFVRHQTLATRPLLA